MQPVQTDQPAGRCGALEFAALAYLCVPLFIFFVGFTPYYLAVPGVAVVAVLLVRLRPLSPAALRLSRGRLLLCGLVAAVFLACCGYLSADNRQWDWAKHYGLFNELARAAWPPVQEEAGTFLRYYLGYYLVPGLAAKAFGERALHLYVLAWTWVGLFLVLALALARMTPKRPALFIGVFLLFSGLDLVGVTVFADVWAPFAHKQWWAGAGLFAYDSHATDFIWAPQHALGGLLGLMLVLAGNGNRLPAAALCLVFTAIAFWSPFAALGAAPFAIAVHRSSWRAILGAWENIACGIVVAVPVLAYLLTGAGDIASGSNLADTWTEFGTYALFVALEFGLVVLAVRLCGPGFIPYGRLAVALLLVLPLYRMGIYNDFTMRTAIPALALVALGAAAALSETRNWRALPLAVLVFAGGMDAVTEMIGRSRDGYIRAGEQSLEEVFLKDHPDHLAFYRAPLPHWTIRENGD